MIALFTDFGLHGPYIGQVQAVLHQGAPDVAVVNLFSDAPRFKPRPGAYLLASYGKHLPEGTIFLCVVDPGVGDPARRGAIVRADGNWYVGPDNGLFNVVARRADKLQWWDITWQPEYLSASFHGRDLFAPVAVMLATGEEIPGKQVDPAHRILPGWTEELPAIIYIDHYGNCISGLRFENAMRRAHLKIHEKKLSYARTFSECPPGEALFYENSSGLLEIAVNQGSAANSLGIKIGDKMTLSEVL